MITGWRGWVYGRRLWLPAVLWVLAVAVVYVWWWVRADWPWTPDDDRYSTVIVGIIPALTGALALYGVLPGQDWVDLQAVTHPQRRDTLAAGLIIVAFAALPPLVRWLFTLNTFYLRFVPGDILSDPLALEGVAPLYLFWGLAFETGIVIGATCLVTGVVGRLLGPLMGIVCYSSLLTIQGYRMMPFAFPRLGDDRSELSLVTGTLVVAIGLMAFRVSRSGARPLIGSAGR